MPAVPVVADMHRLAVAEDCDATAGERRIDPDHNHFGCFRLAIAAAREADAAAHLREQNDCLG
ncbi:hypothetical protein MHPYR_180080 [uncultured Mycobacterium sp.]|uniref:Uncharacterized protein n=1 Tax=uncultured Mycobacterium sp. TaxID=171292 RepID=A0A1Y5PD37_9MYCO|nr:hypothetical protein MHPYR_180080 [uncultured Mycobacterium sp.]